MGVNIGQFRSPYARARVKSLDTSKAKELPGFVDIVTWKDPEIRAMPEIELPLLINEADMEDDEVGAVVVAESEELCDRALKLIKVEWEVLPHILDPREGLKPEAYIAGRSDTSGDDVQRRSGINGEIHF